MADVQQRVGKLIYGKAERDCVHIAVYPVIAGERLYSGDKLKLRYGSSDVVIKDNYTKEAIGIVDPFLPDKHCVIEEGTRFWMYLFPNSIQGLRHHWTLPVIDQPSQTKDEHETWLRQFAERWNFEWNQMIDAAMESGERYICARGRDLHYEGELGDDLNLFWYHIEGYLGEGFTPAHKAQLRWTCSC